MFKKFVWLTILLAVLLAGMYVGGKIWVSEAKVCNKITNTCLVSYGLHFGEGFPLVTWGDF